jgi:hypothetical protein
MIKKETIRDLIPPGWHGETFWQNPFPHLRYRHYFHISCDGGTFLGASGHSRGVLAIGLMHLTTTLAGSFGCIAWGTWADI